MSITRNIITIAPTKSSTERMGPPSRTKIVKGLVQLDILIPKTSFLFQLILYFIMWKKYQSSPKFDCKEIPKINTSMLLNQSFVWIIIDTHMMCGRLGNSCVLLLYRSPCHDTPHLPIYHSSVKLIKEKTINNERFL